MPITVNVQKYEIYHEMYQTFGIQANLDAINQLLVILTNYHDILLKLPDCGHRNSLGTIHNSFKVYSMQLNKCRNPNTVPGMPVEDTYRHYPL